MGHASVDNLNAILLKKIYAKGSASIKDCIEHCKKHKEVLHAGEGDYSDEYMLSWAFEEIVLFHGRAWCENGCRPNIEPIIENEKQKILVKSFNKDGLSNLADYDEDSSNFDNIKWKFTKGTRALYINGKIPIVDYIEN